MLRRGLLFSLLLSLFFLAACSSVARLQIARAHKLQQSGQTERALDVYEQALVRIPAQDGHLRSQTFYQIGDCFWKLGRLNEAFAAFQKAAEADNSNMSAHLRMGEIFLAGGAADRATEQANTVLQLASANVEGLALLGAASSAAGNDEVAQRAFSRVLESDPRRVSVAVALADIYNRQDNMDKARVVLRKATDAQPSSSLPWLALGRLEEQEGNVSAAEDAYRHAVQAEDTWETNARLAQFLQRAARIDEAEQVLRRVDSFHPSLPIALSDFKLLSGQPAVALDHYTTALRSPLLEGKSPSHTFAGGSRSSRDLAKNRAALIARVIESDLQLAATKAKGTARSNATAAARLHFAEYRNDLDSGTRLILEAEMALAEEDMTAATRLAQQAVEAAPESAAALYVRGAVNYQNANETGARADWMEAIEKDSGYVPARLALAEQAFRLGDFKGAEEHVVAVVRDEPASLYALNVFARVLLAQKRYASAALISHRALAVDPESAEPHIILGEIAVARHNVGEALREYEQAIAADPHSTKAVEGLTRVYRSGRITRRMLASLEHVAEMPPASAPLMEIAGRLYAEHGWLDDAARSLRRAIEADPSRSSAALLLADMEARKGNYSGALASGSEVGGSEAALLKGASAERQKDFERASREYDEAVKRGDTTGIAANNLAWLVAEHGGNMERALELAKQARTFAPDDPAVLDTLGFVHLKRREFSQAIDVLKAAARLATERQSDTQLATIQDHLAEAYFRSGQSGRASNTDNR